MILNLEGHFDPVSQQLLYKFPTLSLNRRFNYKIAIKIAHIELLDITQIRENELFCVNSNLIDMSSINPTQTLYFFWLESKNVRQFSIVSDPTFFPLQIYETENCKISFTRFFEGTDIPVKKFLLQFEIQRSDQLNARL